MNGTPALVLIAALLLANPATPGCLIFCRPDLPPQAARTRFIADLGTPLPQGVEVLHLYDGGFQDRFVQVKLRATPEGTAAFLAAFGTSEAALTRYAGEQIGAADIDWWDAEKVTDLRTAEGRLGTFSYARIFVAPEPDSWNGSILYIFAYET